MWHRVEAQNTLSGVAHAACAAHAVLLVGEEGCAPLPRQLRPKSRHRMHGLLPEQEAREADARGARCDEEATDAPEDFSVSARLGRAFVDGYNCVDEDELRRVCGVAPW